MQLSSMLEVFMRLTYVHQSTASIQNYHSHLVIIVKNNAEDASGNASAQFGVHR